MSHVLGNTNIQAEVISRTYLSQFAYHMQLLEFDMASHCIAMCLDKLNKEKECGQFAYDETRLNQHYLVSRYLSMLRDYSLFWSKILVHDFAGSWNNLQDTLDGLRVLKKFGIYRQLPFVDLIECQTVSLEKIYPYGLFASIEAIIGDVRCSVCGKNMDSLECPHIRGELYAGQMAYGIVGKIESLNAIALVEHPADKRCIMQIENTNMSFTAIAYLSDQMNLHKISPWQITGIRESTRKRKIDEFKIVGRNDRCPCGSGKKFKRCCMKVGYVETPHLEILVNNQKLPQPNVSTQRSEY